MDPNSHEQKEMGWRPHEDGGRSWNYDATAKEHLEPPEAGRDKEVS